MNVNETNIHTGDNAMNNEQYNPQIYGVEA